MSNCMSDDQATVRCVSIKLWRDMIWMLDLTKRLFIRDSLCD